jgi:hypothetical protein
MPATRPRSRRAGVYVAVLGVSALVMVLGVGGLAASRAIARSARSARDAAAARWAASSALELTRATMASNSRWRITYANGAWFSATIGSSRVDVQGVNPNGSLDRIHTDPIDLTATATVGSARHAATIRLDAQTTPLSSLGASLAAGGALTTSGATVYARNTTVAANGAVTILLGQFNANVESGLTAVGLTVTGTLRSLAGTREFPDGTVLDLYSRQGTVIPIANLPIRSGNRTIGSILLSPASNTLSGVLNTSGVYIVDAGGGAVVIDSCRIVGTLIILNTTTVTLQGSVVAEPVVANYPCLIIRGNASFAGVATALSESTTGVNYNPSSTPYPYSQGLSNATTTDTFSPSLAGLVYVSGDLTASGTMQVNQLVVGGNVNLSGTLTLSAVSTFRRSPPPGFASIRMVPASAAATKQVTQ